jgi:hypothetical protein
MPFVVGSGGELFMKGEHAAGDLYLPQIWDGDLFSHIESGSGRCGVRC